MLEAPLVAAIGDGFRLTMLVSALYMAIAVIAALDSVGGSPAPGRGAACARWA